VFTDYAMPARTDGNSSRKWPPLAAGEVLLASGYSMTRSGPGSPKNPAVRILNKPYGIAEATSVIAEMLQRQ